QLHEAVHGFFDSSTCRVVNATGVVLHSGLGRAVYADEAIQAVARATTYCLLEVEPEEGKRRRRDTFCEDLLCELTGAEAAFVVNNNAAATMLILAATAPGKEVVVSRSQMIEIGGSFRLPDVFEASGCRLREVGTTNKSYLRDYEGAIGEETGALMLVHTSNYRIVGFTEHVDLPEMVSLGKRRGVPVIHDLGSGSLIDLAMHGVYDEPPVQASVRAGADLICFSGDKLVGGPQSGIIVGKKQWVDRVRKHPLARALRVDKLSCIGLETTLKLYLEPTKLHARIPTLRMLADSADQILLRAEALRHQLAPILGDRGTLDIVPSTSELGAGTLPTHGLPTHCVALSVHGVAADRIGRDLRVLPPVPVFARLREERVLFDPRTLQEGDASRVAEALEIVLKETPA
ncbi:MAG: L-seryl-tRNA(Sec) selenium transferase, partial [Planctomycetes bacterium]|nr:L-seryl-tRNA(Sec) selenium transferase [Planctomycetota bacterium]